MVGRILDCLTTYFRRIKKVHSTTDRGGTYIFVDQKAFKCKFHIHYTVCLTHQLFVKKKVITNDYHAWLYVNLCVCLINIPGGFPRCFKAFLAREVVSLRVSLQTNKQQQQKKGKSNNNKKQKRKTGWHCRGATKLK